MKHIRVLGLAMMCLLFASTAAFAGPIGSLQLTGSDVTYTFTDAGGNTYTEGVSPYGANLVFNGIPFTGYITCLDIANPSYIGHVYSGVWAAPSTFAEKEASWLADQLYGLDSSANPSYVGPISMAIWTVMFPSSTNTDGLAAVPVDPAAAPWLAAASAAVTGGYVPDNYMFLPDDTTSQRFMLNPPAPVSPIPEPGTLAMVGSGVLAFGGVLRRKLAR